MINRREFLHILSMAAAAGMALPSVARSAQAADQFYDVSTFGNVHLLHITDTHGQLLPLYFREPQVNLGVADATGKVPHLVGEHLLKAYDIPAGSPLAHAFTYLDFEAASRRFGRVGGYAHLATLIQRLRAGRPGALLLDGGDTWQGSATALWTKGQDMVDATLLLGVDAMTGHFEFTHGQDRVMEIVDGPLKGNIDFLAQNIETNDFGDPVFPAFSLREMNGVPVAVIGQAFPYTPIANPRWMMPDWTFGIQEARLQETIDEAREKGAQVVVLLSHNGMDVDLKLAGRVRGLDAIFGGHTHDGVPQPVVVSNGGGKTLVTNGGSNGKFVGVMDFDVRDGKVVDFRYKLLPVFSDLIPADDQMVAHIAKVREPYADKLAEKLATTEELLYRRGNFNGTFDQVILDALMAEKDAEIAFSPGFRWGPSMLPGQDITFEDVMAQTAITYPATTLTDMSGEMIKTVLEDVADNLFNPDPYYQQGGDMVRVGGLKYRIDPLAKAGERITAMELAGKPIEADKTYKVAGWAPVGEGVTGEPIWDVVARHLRHRKTISEVKVNEPDVVGMADNPGMA